MEQLLDDVLVLVMQHLSVEDLLACRLVCRRLGELALHRDAWRHRRIDDAKPCACAVLNLAPCLRELVYSDKVHPWAFLTTRCAVEQLVLQMSSKDYNFSKYALLIRNQEALGRLRRIEIWASDLLGSVGSGYMEAERKASGADMLLKTLVTCSDLESLDVRFGTVAFSSFLSYGSHRPSLKYFRCTLDADSDSFARVVLARHADTLEEVDLGSGYCNEVKQSIALLPSLPRLRKLSCEVVAGVEAAAGCKALSDLTLVMDLDEPSEHPVALLQQARQLRRVTLEFKDPVDNLYEDDGDSKVVAALVSPGPSLVEFLSVSRLKGVQALTAALPRLPALRHLVVLHSPRRRNYFGDHPDDSDDSDDLDDLQDLHDLLLGVTAGTAPALRTLELDLRPRTPTLFYRGTPERMECAHLWLHAYAVEAVLQDNPSLHVRLRMAFRCGAEDCAACVLDCHPELSWDGVSSSTAPVGLTAHERDRCPSPRDHPADGSIKWIQVRVAP
ncbi:uncharacterized protein LOC113211027 [Frankliniella occidentalis]|uniref:Uncharacterized protein LOC113211027 n=1 Tax=Frankliniella occidentalis TaxID=133901 RepID=A0A6J1SVZ2_FRAOC|nr:uncharacterized protein LOC113211027 [Frankliniella occidentalis]